MLCDGNTFNYGYIGSRATGNDAGDYMVVGPDWKGEDARRASRRCSGPPRSSRSGLSHPALQPGGHAECGEGAVRLQSAAALGVSAINPRRPRRPTINFPKINKEMAKTGFFDYLDFALQFAPAGPEEKEIRAKLARLGIGAGKKFDFKDLSPEQQGRSGSGHEGR